MGEILRVTASYANCRHNFVILNVPETKKEQITDVLKYTCVIKNLLQRSHYVKPSQFLINSLGDISEEIDTPYYLYNTDPNYKPNWINTILGAENGNNPALDFFMHKWETFLPDLSWIRQFILPEALINDILKQPDIKFQHQRVDFYLPMAKLVIEIDGVQHEEKPAQITLDKNRDDKLSAEGITVIRIPVKILREKTKLHELKSFFSNIKEKIITSADFHNIAEQKNDNAKVLKKRIKYDEIMRFEILLLALIERGALNPQNKSWLFCIEDNKQENFELAFQDLMTWYENLFELNGTNFTRPKLLWSKKANLRIYSKMLYRYDDTKIKDICICTSYLDDNDYFKASSAEAINYNILLPLDKSREAALLFFLKNLFNYDNFNSGQLEIIVNALNLHSTIGILPTGSGKSLCYFYVCLLQPGISLAVCPIISLLQDQKKNFDNFGITRATYISSSQTTKEKESAINNFRNLKYLLLWIAPERFQTETFREQLNKINATSTVIYAVIDEVHCLSEWGHDFRTSYLTLVQTLKRFCPTTILLGLTATASQAVLQDLKIEFNITGNDVKSLASLERNNLHMCVINCNDTNKLGNLKDLLFKKEMASKGNIGIIFSIAKTDKWLNGCDFITTELKKEAKRRDLVINTFHSGLNPTIKEKIQNDFMDNNIDLLVATKAFGMGVNKKNIRYTIHYGLPWSIESFYQEAGRAGRDGEIANCYILYLKEPSSAKESIEKLFSPNLECSLIPEICKENKISYDLNKLFFLWGQNNKGVVKDIEDVEYVIQNFRLNKLIFTINSNQKFSQASIQLALYRLKLLGVVEDWTIEIWEKRTWKELNLPCSITVYLSENAWQETNLLGHLYSYIRKYNQNFGHDKRSEKYNIILKNQKLTVLKRCVIVLIEWTYEYIIYSRRRMMYNMMDLCTNYTDATSFSKKIGNYLKISESTVVLDNIVNEPNNWVLWTELLYERAINPYQEEMQIPLNKSGFESLRMTIARYLESYRDYAGLNLIYVLSGLLSGIYDDKIDNEILNNACEEMQQLHGLNDCWEWIIDILAEKQHDIDKENLALFLEVILSNYPTMSLYSYRRLRDDTSLKYGLLISINKINTILEENYD